MDFNGNQTVQGPN